ncbi:hypothetical protein PCASD_13573 [Puccinia coronata f. sp. avenae]|uniref:Uncharacterized protein n=1 Tax=Puccinia coronata f. sp. avenae TaxID=200324 RepID=A0A2N5TDU6_9BASI|nr:hypothetical protein PCASD_13573 [Puccinia coronata f. sp. avenae]
MQFNVRIQSGGQGPAPGGAHPASVFGIHSGSGSTSELRSWGGVGTPPTKSTGRRTIVTRHTTAPTRRRGDAPSTVHSGSGTDGGTVKLHHGCSSLLRRWVSRTVGSRECYENAPSPNPTFLEHIGSKGRRSPNVLGQRSYSVLQSIGKPFWFPIDRRTLIPPFPNAPGKRSACRPHIDLKTILFSNRLENGKIIRCQNG